jgi:hypothetical protein
MNKIDLIKKEKKAFADFIKRNPDATSADYETWHQVWDELVKLFAIPVVKHRFSQDLEQAKKIKNLFLIYFDGCYGIDPIENTYNTFAMGVCKLEYKDGTLTVHLRRPGLLIGKGGCIIDALAKHLECKIDIVEVSLLK